MKWRSAKLGEVVTLKRGYDLAAYARTEGEIPVLSSSGITGYHNEAKVKGPGVVTGRYGTLGEVFFVHQEFWPLNTTLYVRDFKGNDPRFISYFLRTANLESHRSAGAVPGVNRNFLHALDVRIPDVGTQRRISAILSSYDDLIENNLRRIALLEESARLLYKEWFVRLRFPGYEHTRIVHGVTECWERVFVPEIIDIDPRTNVPKDGEKWFVDMASLPLNSMVISNLERRTGNSGSKFQTGDTLLARITPSLENGKTGFVNFLAEGETAFGSTEFIVLRPKRVSPEFVYCLARTYDFRENAVKSMIGSSGRQRVQVSCFDDFPVALPPRTLLEQFNEFAVACFRQVRFLSLQNEKLKQARDLLLPRLMSGEIEV